MKKFFLPITIIVTLLIIVGGIFLFSKDGENQTSPLPSSYEYFWGDGCSHCANVQAFFDSWDKKDKIQVDKKEVWNNKQNALLMRERANYCHLSQNSLAVPFLFTPQGQCITGDEPIINFFKDLKF